jgi:hypothetical protein
MIIDENTDLSGLPEGDRLQIERFKAFLRITSEAERGKHGGYRVTAETFRYLMGEDIDPLPMDDEHPAAHTVAAPKDQKS